MDTIQTDKVGNYTINIRYSQEALDDARSQVKSMMRWEKEGKEADVWAEFRLIDFAVAE